MKNNRRKIVVILLLAIALICMIAFVIINMKKESNEKIYDDVLEQVKDDNSENNGEKDEEKEEDNSVDFEELKKINDDIYAWIDIEDTNIHYPIVQSATDDTYYLNHTIEGKEGYPGSIYTEKVNSKDFTDFNTVIYGHDMKDETMFKHLHKFKEADFFNTHDTITIHLENGIKTYRVYAAVVYDNRHIMYSYDNGVIDDRIAFINSLKNMAGEGSFFREGMTIDEHSKLITLSTCITGQPDKRYIVVAAEVADS